MARVPAMRENVKMLFNMVYIVDGCHLGNIEVKEAASNVTVFKWFF
jgi:hypothetical protein